ncbi:hypothetical protein F4804DRAFT_84630 [Jackrogersella minutella]|nr:hypothetical protein F4804DRAFT_84630 [Jackrogersella minutella]
MRPLADDTSTTRSSSNKGSDPPQSTPTRTSDNLTEIPKLSKQGLDNRSYELTVGDLGSSNDAYTKYLRKLTSVEFPTLQVVLDFLDRPRKPTSCEGEPACARCHYFRASLLGCFPGPSTQPCKKLWSSEEHHTMPPNNSVEDLLGVMVQLGSTAQKSKPERLILLVEDLKPCGLKFLGAFLDIDPRAFERLLNFRREFTNEISDVNVLGYSQGYYYRDPNGGKVSRNFKDDLLATGFSNGKARRWWTDIVAHEQRVVVAQTAEKSLVRLPVDAVFLYPLPKAKELKFHSKTLHGLATQFKLQPIQPSQGVTLFHEYWNESRPIGSDPNTADNLGAMESKIQAAIMNPEIPYSSKSFAGAAEFVVEKWSSLANRVQEAISETNAPDLADLDLIRTMTRRRHLFSEAKRTLELVRESLNEPCLKEAKASVEKVQQKINQWIAELEGVLSHTTSALNLQEVERAMLQSTRTTQLTILAFVFIPISAVSSGFGMNVDVLQDSPPIWWFFVVSGAVAILTFLYATFFRHVNKALDNAFVGVGLITAALAVDAAVIIVKLVVLVFMLAPLVVVLSFAVPITALVFAICTPFLAYEGIRWVFRSMAGPASKPNRDSTSGIEGFEFVWEFILAPFVVLPMQKWWNMSMTVMDFSPPTLDIRRAWRKGRRVPKPYTREEDYPECIVM